MPIPMGVSVKLIRNTESTLNAVEKMERRVLFQAGAYVRKTASRSIRTTKTKFSKPGEIPRGKTGILRKTIRFAVDERSVVIGPIVANTKDPENIARLHEFGGTIRRKPGRVPIPKREVRKSQKVKPGDEPYPSTKIDKRLLMVLLPAIRRYEPRPYMGPALQKMREQNVFPELFADQLKATG